AVLFRLVDRVVLSGDVVHREAAGKSLNVMRLGQFVCVRLTGLLARFKSSNVLRASQRKKIALLRCVQKIRSMDSLFAAALQALDGNRLDPIPGVAGSYRLVAQEGDKPASVALGRRHSLQIA